MIDVIAAVFLVLGMVVWTTYYMLFNGKQDMSLRETIKFWVRHKASEK
jgi:hypothetical protein